MSDKMWKDIWDAHDTARNKAWREEPGTFDTLDAFKAGAAWQAAQSEQPESVPVVGEPVAEAYVYEDVDGDDILGLRLLKEDYPMQHGEKLYIEPTTSITHAELDALVSLVEGFDWHDWRNKDGLRLKDTPEWVAFYCAVKRIDAAIAAEGEKE